MSKCSSPYLPHGCIVGCPEYPFGTVFWHSGCKAAGENLKVFRTVYSTEYITIHTIPPRPRNCTTPTTAQPSLRGKVRLGHVHCDQFTCLSTLGVYGFFLILSFSRAERKRAIEKTFQPPRRDGSRTVNTEGGQPNSCGRSSQDLLLRGPRC